MTKLESAEEIIKQGGECTHINCLECCCGGLGFKCNAKHTTDALAIAIKYKKEHEMKFKVGDKVKWNGIEEGFTVCMTGYRANFLKSKKEHVISFVDNRDNTCLLVGCKPYWFNLEWLEKVESKTELIKGKRYEVSNNEDFSNSRERIFDSYDEGFPEPYRCIDCMFEDEYENKFCIETDTWKYLREIQPKYEPYTEPKLEWIDKDIVHKRNKNMACYIDSITRDSCDENVFAIRTDWGTEYTCKQLFKDWNWADGSIIGKEIK